MIRKERQISLKGAMSTLAGVLLISGIAIASTPSSKLYDKTATLIPTNPDSVQILRKDPDQAFVKIADIEFEARDYNFGIASESDQRENPKTFERKLKEEAARIGGDAIIILRDKFAGAHGGNRGVATMLESSTGKVYDRKNGSKFKFYGRKVSGIVIKFQ